MRAGGSAHDFAPFALKALVDGCGVFSLPVQA
jgi:hypothetical protein